MSRRVSNTLVLFDEFTALGVEIWVASGSAIGRIDNIKAVFLSLCAMEERARLLRTTGYASWRAAASGANMGGIPYGFRRGPKAGTLAPEATEQEVVVRIFTLFVSGVHPRNIAFILNKDGIESPDGGLWTYHAIIGRPSRGDGILRNTKYIGWYIHGRSMTLRTPGRAKTKRTLRSPSLWVKLEKPDWGFVDPVLWGRADELLCRWDAAKEGDGEQTERRSGSVLLLHGRYECTCGSKMRAPIRDGVRSLHCAAAREFGTCDRPGFTSSLFVETEILREIRDNILSDEAVALFARTYVEAMKQARTTTLAARARLLLQIERIDEQILGSAVQSARAGFSDETMIRVREVWEQERARLISRVAELRMPDRVADFDPEAARSLRFAIDDLIMRMPIKAATEEEILLVAALRRLIVRVLHDRPPGQAGYRLVIEASLVDLVSGTQGADVHQPVVRYERTCPPPHTGTVRMPELMAFYGRKAEANEWGTTDEDWAVVSEVWRDYKSRHKREILDATLFYLRCGILGFRHLPPPFDVHGRSGGMGFMISSGRWQLAYNALVAIGSPTVADLNTDCLVNRIEGRNAEPPSNAGCRNPWATRRLRANAAAPRRTGKPTR
ncbi:resolvase [Methylobacterium sp. BTF04]|uniref:recombinase family protein n=1 Tax=Methylobacterium sp. BTF04 TaxID=2708300 RepID=UPI0013D7BC3F|nr:recombinase family protein [Methylobacterium sp. BTF04]NEU13789.1 resolvase [Methylobacterium sp. BTF04]